MFLENSFSIPCGSCFKIIFLNIYFTLFCYFLAVRHLVTGYFNKNKNIPGITPDFLFISHFSILKKILFYQV